MSVLKVNKAPRVSVVAGDGATVNKPSIGRGFLRSGRRDHFIIVGGDNLAG